MPIYPRQILVNAIQLIGICGWRTEGFVRALHRMGSGRVDVNPIITQSFPLDEWEDAFKRIVSRKDESIKVEFDMGTTCE